VTHLDQDAVGGVAGQRLRCEATTEKHGEPQPPVGGVKHPTHGGLVRKLPFFLVGAR
jgi:hypothetical protein